MPMASWSSLEIVEEERVDEADARAVAPDLDQVGAL